MIQKVLRTYVGKFFYAILNVNGDKRNVNVNQVNPDNKFNDDYRVLVRDFLWKNQNPPKNLRRILVCELFLPAAQHFAYFH